VLSGVDLARSLGKLVIDNPAIKYRKRFIFACRGLNGVGSVNIEGFRISWNDKNSGI
jgi:hypothetical protein